MVNEDWINYVIPHTVIGGQSCGLIFKYKTQFLAMHFKEYTDWFKFSIMTACLVIKTNCICVTSVHSKA